MRSTILVLGIGIFAGIYFMVTSNPPELFPEPTGGLNVNVAPDNGGQVAAAFVEMSKSNNELLKSLNDQQTFPYFWVFVGAIAIVFLILCSWIYHSRMKMNHEEKMAQYQTAPNIETLQIESTLRKQGITLIGYTEEGDPIVRNPQGQIISLVPKPKQLGVSHVE